MRTDDGRLIPTFVAQALRGEPLTVHGSGAQTRTLCYVDDTLAGLLSLLTSDLPGPVNIGGTTELTVLQIAHMVRSLTASDSEIRFLPGVEDDPRVRRPDITLARSALGWHPRVPVAEGIGAVIEWTKGRERAALRQPGGLRGQR
jgi:dTDP-glucose 4,6-dehydratase